MTIEVDAYLWHHGMAVGIFAGCNLNRGDEVFLAICAQLSDGQLRARKDDGLGQVLQHVGEGRGGIGHRVGAMQHDKAVVVVVVVGYNVRQVSPQSGRHIAGVDGRIELVGGNLRVKLLQFRHVLQQVLEVERLQGSRLWIAVHSYCSASINE